MMPDEIFKKFQEVYPIDDSEIECWFPNGKHSVRIHMKDHTELILTYHSKKKWKIETVDQYLDDLETLLV